MPALAINPRTGRDQNGGLSSLREPGRSQVAIVFFAGHGVRIEGRNWLVAVDA